MLTWRVEYQYLRLNLIVEVKEMFGEVIARFLELGGGFQWCSFQVVFME